MGLISWVSLLSFFCLYSTNALEYIPAGPAIQVRETSQVQGWCPVLHRGMKEAAPWAVIGPQDKPLDGDKPLRENRPPTLSLRPLMSFPERRDTLCPVWPLPLIRFSRCLHQSAVAISKGSYPRPSSRGQDSIRRSWGSPRLHGKARAPGWGGIGA